MYTTAADQGVKFYERPAACENAAASIGSAGCCVRLSAAGRLDRSIYRLSCCY